MSAKYVKLKNDWCLRGWDDNDWAAVNWRTGKLFKLTSKTFYVVNSCDGCTDFNSMAFLPEHHDILDAAIKDGVVKECGAGDSIKNWQRYRKAGNPYLKEIHWCVTGLCNLRCIHCFMEAPSGRYGELPYKDIVRIIEQFEISNIHRVSITGGEPFRRKDFLEILRLLAEKRIWVSQIYTNSLLITDEILIELVKIGLHPDFQISFDGLNGHDYMRGVKGIENNVIEKIRMVRATGFPVIIASTVDKKNIGTLEKTYNLLKSLDVQAWRVGTPIKMGNWKRESASLSFDDEVNAYEPLLELWNKDGRPFELVLGQFLRTSGTSDKIIPEEAKITYAPEDYDCGYIRKNLYLLPDGTILPCAGYTDSAIQRHMPNILENGLLNAYLDSSLQDLMNKRKQEVLISNPDCGSCEYFGNCGAGCRASALRETKELMNKDPITCTLWKQGYKQRFQQLADEVDDRYLHCQ